MTATDNDPSQRLVSRPAQDDRDFWRVQDLLIETVPITPTGWNWDIRRWEGKRFYDAHPTGNPRWTAQVCLWETAGGRLAGAVNGEGRGDAHLQLHPDYRHIEAEMIAWAESNLAAPAENPAVRQLHIFAYEYDAPRRSLLEQRGFEKMSYGGVCRRLRFGHQPLAKPALAPDYTLRTTRPDDLADGQRIADLLNAAFNRDFHTAEEYLTFTRLAPSFRQQLDLVAVAPDGSFAAYVGIPYDEVNRRGIFEPVCTHPGHRRKRLALALMQEGLRRLKAMGAVDVTVETGDMVPANRLYDAVGFTEAYRGYAWRKFL